jgi:hypothetical protein
MLPAQLTPAPFINHKEMIEIQRSPRAKLSPDPVIITMGAIKDNFL